MAMPQPQSASDNACALSSPLAAILLTACSRTDLNSKPIPGGVRAPDCLTEEASWPLAAPKKMGIT